MSAPVRAGEAGFGGNRRSNRRQRDLVSHQLLGAGQMPSFDASAVAS
jgi:hypothetical protein